MQITGIREKTGIAFLLAAIGNDVPKKNLPGLGDSVIASETIIPDFRISNHSLKTRFSRSVIINDF